VPTLRTRSIAASCGMAFPLSVRQALLNGQAGALKAQLAALQAECRPWEVIVENSGHMAIHAAVLPMGEVLYFGGWFQSAGFYRFDVVTEGISDEFEPFDESEPTLPTTDVFCGGQAFLADGQLLVGGGEVPPPADGSGEDLHGHGGMSGGGSRACWLYRPLHRTWRPAADMNLDPAGNPDSGGRWYPTLTTLYDNRVLAVGGHPNVREAYPSPGPDQRHNNNTPERYSPPQDAWTLLTAEAAQTAINGIRDEYHRTFLLPNGLVFFATVVKSFNRLFDPYGGTFSSTWQIPPPADDIYHQGSQGSAILLPLLPGDGYTPRVLACNGVHPRRIELSGNAPTWGNAGQRDWQGQPPERNHACTVILPDGRVFVSGGTAQDGTDAVRQQNAVREGELYDPGIDWDTGSYGPPSSQEWTTVQAAAVRRHYHSVAVLLPNGTVWTGGSNGPGGEDNQERRIEVYRPPYCAEVNRPVITAAPDRLVYGSTFGVRTPQAADIQRVALIRNGSVTHAFDGDQRYVALEFNHAGGDLLTVTAPPHSAVAPPGFYMLWIVDADGRPCRWAAFVNVSALSVRITAAACGLAAPVSLLGDVFTVGQSQTKSLRQQLHVMQRECLFPSI
jgi:hypothetical protein